MSIHYVECPYCNKETEIELEGQDCNEDYTTDCEECGRYKEKERCRISYQKRHIYK
jgi:hypothetical protein